MMKCLKLSSHHCTSPTCSVWYDHQTCSVTLCFWHPSLDTKPDPLNLEVVNGADGYGLLVEDCMCSIPVGRQMVARSMLDTLRAVGDDQESCTAVLDSMARLSQDTGQSDSGFMSQIVYWL